MRECVSARARVDNSRCSRAREREGNRHHHHTSTTTATSTVEPLLLLLLLLRQASATESIATHQHFVGLSASLTDSLTVSACARARIAPRTQNVRRAQPSPSAGRPPPASTHTQTRSQPSSQTRALKRERVRDVHNTTSTIYILNTMLLDGWLAACSPPARE